MDESSASVPSGSLDILPDLPPSRRDRKRREVPRAYPAAPTAQPVLAPPVQPAPIAPPIAPPAAPPTLAPAPQVAPPPTLVPVAYAAPPAPVAPPTAPSPTVPLQQPVVATGPVPVRAATPPAPAPAPPVQAPPPAAAAGIQALKEAFAIDVAERENRHRAEMHALEQSHALEVGAREDRRRAEIHTLQQTLKDIREQLGHAVSDRDHQSQARATAEAELRTHRSAYEALRSELDSQRSVLDRSTARVHELEASLAAAQQETERWSEQARRTEADRRTAVVEAERAAAQAAGRFADITSRLQTSEDRNARLAEQTAAHEAAGQQLRNTIAEQRMDRERLTAQRDTAQQRCAELATELRNNTYDAERATTERSSDLTDDSVDDELATDDLYDPLGQQRAELERVRAERDAARRQAAALEAELEGLIDEPHALDNSEQARSLCASEPLPYPSEGTADDAAAVRTHSTSAPAASDDHPVSLAAEIDLDPWQREALAAWADGAHRGVVEAITEEGRTRLAYWAIGQALDLGMKVLVVVPSVDGVEQWHRGLREALPINRVAKHTNGKDARLASYDVVVSTAESAAKGSVFGPHFEGLLVAVDVHALGTAAAAPALDRAYSARLGITAAYERDDDGIATYLDPYFRGVSFRLWYGRALEEKVVAPFDIALVSVPFGAAEQVEYDACEKHVKDLRAELVNDFGLPAKPFAALRRNVEKLAAGRAGPARTAARNYQKAVAKRDELVANSTVRDPILRALASRVRGSEGALVFTSTQQAAAHTSRVLEGQGCPTSMHSGPERGARRADGSRDDDSEVFLVAGRHAGADGDGPSDVDLAILVGASRSKRQMIQRLDQVITKKPDGRHGHLVVVYVEGTVEDDHTSDEAPVITTVMARAARIGRFSAGETDGLLDFLASGWQMTVPIATSMAPAR
ncbi:MAG TPA: DEAD/DEAH box helicase family protein [Mycobacteriales bacterium]|nr:DEAD/DEAH box helicase family protein [Mycobacteriales bacterium]